MESILDGVAWWVVIKSVVISTFICVLVYEVRRHVHLRDEHELMIADWMDNLDEEYRELLEQK